MAVRLGNLIDSAIEPFAPGLAARRSAARMAFAEVRKYQAAARDRRTAGWSRPSTSGNAEIAGAHVLLRNGTRDLVRNNPYASTAVRQITNNIWGDGIAPQFSHPDPKVAQFVQADWNRWAEAPVDGFDDWYGVGKLATRGMVEAGETLVGWRPDDAGPDGRVRGMESDYLDSTRNDLAATHGVRSILGVQLKDGDRVGFWLYDQHPGDMGSTALRSSLVPAQHVDHIFERERFDDVRGVSWLGATALALRDIADIEDAVLRKKKVEACLAILITPGEGPEGSALGQIAAQDGRPGAPKLETLSPGMIARLQPGESVNTLEPTSTGDGVDLLRHKLAAVSAGLVPYHVLTGDVSQANYSSLRAANLAHWALLDDWQQNVMIPRFCRPAVMRRLRRLWLATGDRRVLEVGISWALPKRAFTDPVKDLMAELMEIRAGLKLMSRSLAERGINSSAHLQGIADLNAEIDRLNLVLESDPRRTTGSGVLQSGAGLFMPKADQAAA